MECGCMKDSENIYLRCRKDAAKYNERLKSRENAAELLGVSVSSLANYELGVTKVIPPDVIIMMADLYNAPQLKTIYCANECPIGKGAPIATEVKSIEQVTIKLLKSLSPEKIDEIKERLVDIAEDGVIGDDEKPDLAQIVEYLDYLIKAAGELKLISQKVLGKGRGE